MTDCKWCLVKELHETFKRARKPEEKAQRRAAILATARELATEQGPIELSLNELGRRSGVSKPNIYRYFESREEILLCLLLEEFESAVTELEAKLEAPPQALPQVAKHLAQAFLTRPLLCRLLGISAAILEHNLSPEAIAEAKTTLLAQVIRLKTPLTRALPWLSPSDAAWAVQAIALYVAGLWPAAHPSPSAAKVLARPEFLALLPKAESDLTRFVAVLFAGLKTQADKA